MFRKLDRKSFKVIAVFIILCIVGLFAIEGRKIYVEHMCSNAYNVASLRKFQLDEAVDDSVKNVMIVAHPDDELLWGGGHLMTKDYLVVCMTNGANKERAKEFKNVVKASGNKYIILNYPDKVAGKRDDWVSVKEQMMSDIDMIVNYKNWDMIVTHNQHGEYGHIQHQSVHSFVTEVYDRSASNSKFYCFGRYYRAVRMPSVKDKLKPISREEYEYKKKLSELYSSQQEVIKNLWHMSQYEMWTEYKKYSEHPQLKYDSSKQKSGRIGDLVNEI